MDTKKIFTAFVAWLCLISQLSAQGPQQYVQRPQTRIFWRPYIGPAIAPVRLSNSSRLYSLIREGKLYLTVQDAIAVAIENSLDLEVDRYGPVSAEWNLERLQAGGALQGVPAGNTLVNQATGGQGIAGSQASAGLGGNGGGGGGGGGNAVISQIGPVTQNLDPVLQSAVAFSHTTQPQPNTLQSKIASLIDTRHIYNNVVQQGLLSGGFVQLSFNESYLKENAPSNSLNPSVAPVMQIFATHQFLRGFGVGVNSRFIRVAEKNLGGSRETFRSRLLNVVVSVLNLYWDLVTDNDDLKVRQRALDAAQKVVDDTKKQIDLGVVPRVDIYRAQGELSTRRQDFAISQAAVRQQETLLKNALSRNGLADPAIDAAEVVPLDRIQVPDKDDLPPLRDMVARALKNRPDVVLSKIADETAAISALGTANGVLPILRGIASTTNVGLAGVAQPGADPPDPYYVGGFGTAVGQVFRRNFPSQRAAILFQGTLQNRIAQGDYGIDQLQIKQGDLIERRNMNQIVVNISNQMTALRQARARYSQAVDSRALQQDLLLKEQQMFSFGTSTIANVVIAQRALISAQAAEVASLSAYSHARIALDQVLGETLEANHVSVTEGVEGQVSRPSILPPNP
jgi:outer membrane protein